MGLDKIHRPPTSSSLIRSYTAKNILTAQLAKRLGSHSFTCGKPSETSGTWSVFEFCQQCGKSAEKIAAALLADALWHFAKGKVLLLI